MDREKLFFPCYNGYVLNMVVVRHKGGLLLLFFLFAAAVAEISLETSRLNVIYCESFKGSGVSGAHTLCADCLYMRGGSQPEEGWRGR